MLHVLCLSSFSTGRKLLSNILSASFRPSLYSYSILMLIHLIWSRPYVAQGAAQAVEDAATLAILLSSVQKPLSTAESTINVRENLQTTMRGDSIHSYITAGCVTSRWWAGADEKRSLIGGSIIKREKIQTRGVIVRNKNFYGVGTHKQLQKQL